MGDEAPGDLQFDHAEFTGTSPGGPAVCGRCGRKLDDTYYQVDHHATCEACKSQVELERDQGSGIGRFLRATVYGSMAGAAGALLWYGVRTISGYEVGLIAVVVGLMVGAAVRAGSGRRGGWLYQALAVFLTYTAIVSTYVPLIIQGLREAASAPIANASPSAGAQGAPDPVAPAPPETAPTTEPVPAAAPVEPPMSPGRALVAVTLALVLVMAFAYATPFLGGFENLMGLAIIGFALWEAWKMNRLVPVVITGPYRVGSDPGGG